MEENFSTDISPTDMPPTDMPPTDMPPTDISLVSQRRHFNFDDVHSGKPAKHFNLDEALG